MSFIIVYKNDHIQIIIKNLTKCSTLNTFALKNYGKFAAHNLENILCPWSSPLAAINPVLGLVRVCPRKIGPWPRIVFLSLWPWPRTLRLRTSES